MGKKADFSHHKKGPGKKAKRQQEPKFDVVVKEKTSLSSNQRKRAKKRALIVEKNAEKAAKKIKILEEKKMKKLSTENSVNELLTEQKKPKVLFESDSDESSIEDDNFAASSMDEDSDNEDLKGSDSEESPKINEQKDSGTTEIPSLENVQNEIKNETYKSENVLERIKDTLFVLSDFKNRKQEGRSRSEYMSIFKSDICFYYNYNEFLIEKFIELFPITEFLEFIEACEAPRPTTIRINLLKARRKDLMKTLIDKGVNLDILNWCPDGIVIYSSNIAIGATPEYLSGCYMIQSASSFLPVMALNPQSNDYVLDMCAAPGGKSSHIVGLMKNTGFLVSNDAKKERTKAIYGNLHRMGAISNVQVTSQDGLKFGKTMPNMFDKVLLDAPCTGTGVISKDPGVKASKTQSDVQTCSKLQKELILSAIDTTKVGGYIVYSTCSLLVEENEEVVNYALKKRNVQCIDTKISIGTPGFHNFVGKSFSKEVRNAKRIYPHIHNMDGFFFALLKKQ